MAMSRLEDWAATKIQALARGGQGRAKATARRLEHMARWKEMYDDDRGANFYYNKARSVFFIPRTTAVCTNKQISETVMLSVSQFRQELLGGGALP